MFQRHARPLFLCLMISYLHALNHSVTVGAVKKMLFLGLHIKVNHWRNCIHIWRSCLRHYWRYCKPHLFPLLIKWKSLASKYHAFLTTCAVWLILPSSYYISYVQFLLKPGTPWYTLSRQPNFILVRISAVSRSECPSLGISCNMLGARPLSICVAIGGCLCWMSLGF